MSKSLTLLSACVLFCFAVPLKMLSQSFSPNRVTTNENIPFNFTLPNVFRTSAGVFKADSTLIRTLWSNELKQAGTYTLFWDGKDDNGIYVPDTTYQVNILSNNVIYTWEGVVGNTSVNSTGSTVYHPAQMITNMAFVDSTCYTAIGYNETADPFYRFNISNPNIVTKNLLRDGGQTTRFLATDGHIVYYAGQYQDGITSFVTGIVPGVPDALASFANGTPLQDHHILYSAFDIGSSLITGLTVQTNGSYLFVAHESEDKLRVFEKTTGALVHSIMISSPRELAYDSAGRFLWMVSGTATIAKYPINPDGTIGAPLLALSGITEALDVAVSPDATKVAVVNRGIYHQVKFFDAATGAAISTIGRPETYLNPAVYDDKFYFNNTRIFSESDYGTAHAFVEFQPDGSFWVGDYGNMRCQHFAADNSYINNIQYMGYSYSSQADINNPTRIFSDFLEFEVDYSKPLLPSNGSWKFIRNWSKNITIPAGYDADRMRDVVTLGNGRTYALYNDHTSSLEVIELVPETGIRHTGIHLDYYINDIFSDGSQWQGTNNHVGTLAIWRRKALTGFDGSNNPIWGGFITVESTPPVLINDPLTMDGYSARDYKGSSGVIATFCRSTRSGWHIGGVKNGKWLFKSLPATNLHYSDTFPTDAYEIGNSTQYSGTFMQSVGQNIFCGQNCEGWKGGQVNKHKHFWDNGLQVGEFGATIVDSRESGMEAYPGMAGNANSGTYVKVGSDIYFYHCDEGQHAGVHRWKITGLNTIQEQTIEIVKSCNPSAQAVDYVDLMAGLPEDQTLVNGTAGWTRSSTFDYENGYFDKLRIKTRRYTYKKQEMDLYFLCYPPAPGQTSWVKRDLGTNTGLANWEIKGRLAYPEGSEHDDNFIDILDNNDRVIVRISRPETYPYTDIKANGVSIVHSNNLYYVMYKLQPFNIRATNGTITVTYADYAPVIVSAFDSLANWANPKTLRLQFYSVYLTGHQVDVANLRFYKNTNTALPVTFTSVKAYQKATGIQVEWTTGHESSIDKHEIWKSFDGQKFFKTGEVLAKPVTTVSNQYNWFDAASRAGNNYYRIKVIDNSGVPQQSKTVNVKIRTGSGNFEIYPNPMTDGYGTVQFNNIPKGVYTVTLITIGGQTVFNKIIRHPGGSASQTFVDASLPRGNYNLLITGNGISFSRQVLK